MNSHQTNEITSFELCQRNARQERSDALASMFVSLRHKIQELFVSTTKNVNA